MLSDVREGGKQVFWTSNFYFFAKENWICTMTRHHANNILLIGNLPFDSGVRQWSYILMIPLHYLRAKSNNRTLGQFEYNVTFVFFVLVWFRSFTCTVRFLSHCLRFNQSKQVDCKMSTKKNYFKKTFRDIFLQLHKQECKATKK